MMRVFRRKELGRKTYCKEEKISLAKAKEARRGKEIAAARKKYRIRPVGKQQGLMPPMGSHARVIPYYSGTAHSLRTVLRVRRLGTYEELK
jgi:hypothetical protein